LVSTWLSPSFWQNLIQYCCLICSIIFAQNNNVTSDAYTLSLTHWLHVINAVCWRKETHVCTRRSPPSPYHSTPSLVSMEKNHIRYFLNRPRILTFTLPHLPYIQTPMCTYL
jgi:hypothetical protein